MTWNFRVYSRAYGNSRDQEQNFHLIKKIEEFPWVLVFGLGIPGVKLRFLQNFQWESDKPKNYMDFFRKKYVSTTGLDFFWNSTILKYERVGDESRWDINLK